MKSSTIALSYVDFSIPTVKMEKIFITFCLLVAVYCFLVILKLVFKRRASSKKMPGKKFRLFNLLGNSSDIPLRESTRKGLSFHVWFLQILGAYTILFHNQKLFCFWIAYIPFVVLTKAEAVEELLSGTKIMEKSFLYSFIQPWLGSGLLTSPVSKWKPRRKLLTPSFHFEILKEFLPIFNEQSQILVKRLRQEIKKDFTSIITPVTLCSLDIICETILGVSIGAQDNRETEYVKAVSNVTEILMDRALKHPYLPEFIFRFTKNGKQLAYDLKLLHNFTKSVIQERKRKLLNKDDYDIGASTRKRKSLMDVLLEHHIQTKSLTEEDIREEVDTFTFAGHDTTSLGICWALYLIGLHKDIQEKVHEELYSIFGDDIGRSVIEDDLRHMKYLDCVLKESQRLYPSIPMFGREITEETNICGYTVPKGASCVVFTYHLHRDESVFPNPEKFDPDRFLPENSSNRHPYAYVPFSAGPRNCIGQRFALIEEKVVLSAILRNYTLQSLDERDKVLPVAEITLKPVVPLRIKIRPRHLIET